MSECNKPICETGCMFPQNCPEEKGNGSLAAPSVSRLTDAQKIGKAIELLERLERECLVPDFAHDAFGSCQICRLISELKAPNLPYAD